MTYSEQRRKESDKHLSTVVRILAPWLFYRSDQFSIASPELDMNEASDLVTMNGRWRIAVRIRKHKYLEPYGGQFTVRATPEDNNELLKIRESETRWLFYGFETEQRHSIRFAWLGDLNKFRTWLFNNPTPTAIQNLDGSKFYAFDVHAIPGFIERVYRGEIENGRGACP